MCGEPACFSLYKPPPDTHSQVIIVPHTLCKLEEDIKQTRKIDKIAQIAKLSQSQSQVIIVPHTLCKLGEDIKQPPKNSQNSQIDPVSV